MTLSEFADSDLPAGKGRLKKASSVISHVRQISTSEDIDIVPADDEGELNSFNAADTLSVTAGAIQQSGEENNNEYTEYPIKIWLLLAEYIRPEDVKSFSLICKTTLSVVTLHHFGLDSTRDATGRWIFRGVCPANVLMSRSVSSKRL